MDRENLRINYFSHHLLTQLNMASNKDTTKIAIPPTATSNLPVLVQLLKGQEINARYYPRLLFSYLISTILAPFRQLERLQYNKKIAQYQLKNPPIFVLGHWRSGTTHLHNLLCQDPQFGYFTTYHSVFPELLLHPINRFIFRNIASRVMPSRRAGDNVVLKADYPQEEEFALGNVYPSSFYYFWFFPKETLSLFDQHILYKNFSPQQINDWQQSYLRQIKKALLNTQKETFISKNPPNTGRVPQLLSLFPNARFVYIHRNPYHVFLSTRRFFSQMMPYLQYHDISPEQRDKQILLIYNKIMHKYEQDKQLIPPNQLVEVRFEQLEKEPLPILQNIYKTLNLTGFNEAKTNFETYINAKKNYKKNKHKVSQQEIDRIRTHWQFFMEKYGYDIPENLTIT